MCMACCASAALLDAKDGQVSIFRWNPKQKGRLVNNVSAPPEGGTRGEATAEEHALVVQVEGKQAEGPGRIRFAFPNRPWSPWVEAYDLTSAMGCLSVDLAWQCLPVDHPVRSQDSEALLARLRNGLSQGAAWRAGDRAGRALRHAGKVSPRRVVALADRLRTDGLPVETAGHEALYVQALLAAMVRPPIRRRAAVKSAA